MPWVWLSEVHAGGKDSGAAFSPSHLAATFAQALEKSGGILLPGQPSTRASEPTGNLVKIKDSMFHLSLPNQPQVPALRQKALNDSCVHEFEKHGTEGREKKTEDNQRGREIQVKGLWS